MVKFKDFSRPLSVFQVLFRQILFSRTFQDSLVYPSTFQACANPGNIKIELRFFEILANLKIHFGQTGFRE